MIAVNWSAEPPVLTLQELLAKQYYRGSAKAAQAKLARGHFPIKHIDVRPYRFNRRDVEAYVERGEKTNPLLLNPRLRRAKAA